MSNTVATQVIMNGSKDYIIKYTAVGDGSGEVTAGLVNAVTGDMGTTNSLLSVRAICTGCTANLLWDATTDLQCIGLPQDKDVHFDFRSFGGLPNNAGSGKTGDINLTSVGLGSGDTITLVLHVRKS